MKDELVGFNCEICGVLMVIKMGKYGKFYVCFCFLNCCNIKVIVKDIGVECLFCY